MTESEKKQYMISSAIAGTRSYYPENVSFYENSKATPLIDGNEYFKDLIGEIKQLESGDAAFQGICISGWVATADLELDWPNDDGTSTKKTIITVLKEQAARGVDVRVLLWVSDYLADTSVHVIPDTILGIGGDISSVVSGNLGVVVAKNNLEFIQQLRQDPLLEDKIHANTLDISWGSVHVKMCVVYSKERACAYTGSADLSSDRKADYGHESYNWHELQVKVEGDGVTPLYEHFRYMWNELVRRKEKYLAYEEEISSMDGGIEPPEEPYPIPFFLFKGEEIQGTTDMAEEMNGLPTEVKLTISDSQNIIQSLRTLPIVTSEEPFKGAKNGIFEIGLAISKLIAAAKSYIYIEDQYLYSGDILTYIVEALRDTNRPDLVVIMLTTNGAYLNGEDHNLALDKFLYSELTAAQTERVKVFYHQSVFLVHSKLYIADDVCYVAGSANCGNRSLYTDLEHSVSVIDKDGYDSVKNLRIRLWAEHFKITDTEKTKITDVNAGLNVWNPKWRPSSAYSYTSPGFKLPQWAGTSAELSSETQTVRPDNMKGSALRWSETLVPNHGVLEPHLSDVTGCWLLIKPVSGTTQDLKPYVPSFGITLNLTTLGYPESDWAKYTYDLFKPNIVAFSPKSSLLGFANPVDYYAFFYVRDPGTLPGN